MPLKLPALGTTVIAFRKGEAAPALHAVSTSGGELSIKDDRTVELRDTAAGSDTVVVADGTSRTATIGALPAPIAPTSWRLHVAGESAGGTTPFDLQLDALKDWRELPQLAGVSGVGTYTTTIDLPADWAAADRGAYLDLGTVAGTARRRAQRQRGRARLGRGPPLGRLGAVEAGRQRADGAGRDDAAQRARARAAQQARRRRTACSARSR